MRRALRTFGCLAVLLLATVGLASPAGAAVVCTFTAPTATVTADAGDEVVVVRSGEAIHVNQEPCDTATVSNTDTIAIEATGVVASVTIDLSGGPFAPGATVESDDSSEIEFNLPADVPLVRVLGSAEADHVTAGAGGINLNANETTPDVDVPITGTPSIEIEGGDGDDVLSIAGGAGTGAAIRGTLRGGPGNDTLLTGAPGSAIDGGDGIDTIDYHGASAGVVVNLRGGSASGQGTDVLRNIENVIGSAFNDTITGDDEANVLDGGDGDDTIDGGDGDDELIGGAGEDTVSFRSSSTGVTVDLKKGTAEGAGNDTLSGFEHVIGSPKADEIWGDGGENRLEGLAGADSIYGRAGDDLIMGGNGNDRLFGQGGDDILRGERGRDQLNGGKGTDHCKGGPGPDSFVLCENFPT